VGEPQAQLQTLQTYLENHLRKTGQNPATIQQNKQLRMSQQLEKEESKRGSNAYAGAVARKKNEIQPASSDSSRRGNN